MQANAISGPPEVEQEVERSLEKLKKRGYQVVAQPDPSGGLVLDFKFGATEQSIKFNRDEWQKPGAVEKRILDKLEI